MVEQTSTKPEILIVDDSKVVRKAATKMLGEGYVVLEAVDGDDGWVQIQQNSAISVVFCDIQMPGKNGMELLSLVRNAEDERISSLPIIMITGQGDTEEIKHEVFEAGATDFVAKPFKSIDLLTRAKSYVQFNSRIVELEKQTGYDQLTGLVNAASFEAQGEKALAFAERHGVSISTVYLEIVDFDEFYQAQGKLVASQIINAVAKRFDTVLRTEDIAARIGVARYALLLPLTSHTHARIVVERIRASIGKLVFDTGKEKIRIELAAGMTTPEVSEGIRFVELMEQADISLQRALVKAGEKIASFVGAKQKSELAPKDDREEIDKDLMQAFQLVLEGDYFKIERQHLTLLVERISPFMDYVEHQAEPIAEDIKE